MAGTFAVTEASFDAAVLGVASPVLVDLWAPWCAPCKRLAPILEALASEYDGTLVIAKLDVEQHPELQRRYGVRGIPTMILFESGAEKARLVGTKSRDELRRWLARAGIPPAPTASAAAPAAVSVAPAAAGRWGAFYGDAQLREFLLLRLRERAAEGRVESAFEPRWRPPGRGTLAAALVGHAHPEIFARISGLPASLAAALDLCTAGPVAVAAVDAMFAAIPTGADVGAAAPRLAIALLDGSVDGWRAVFDDPALHALRERWIALAAQALAGRAIAAADWQSLASALEALRSADADPDRQTQDALVDLLVALCPLPGAEDGTAWTLAFGLHGVRLAVILAQHRLGWTALDHGLERRRNAWFAERERALPGGLATEEALVAARTAWEAGPHAASQQRLGEFMRDYPQRMAPVVAALRGILGRLTAAAPLVAAE